MADDITFQTTVATPPSGAVVATDDVGGKHYQKIKVALGAENAVDTMLDSGQQTMTNSVPVVVASDQSAVPVSASSLPLPAGASTSANQSTIIGHLDGVEGLLTTIDADTSTLAGAVSGSEMQVDLVAALPAGNNNIGDVDIASLPNEGQQTMANSISVAVASDQSAIPVSASSLPLPTGAATLAEQQTQSASLSVLDDWDESDRAKVNLIAGQAGITAGAGTVGASTPRVTLASDDPAVTALQLIDDAVFAEDVAANAGDKGLAILAVRRDADTSLVGADNDYANLQVNANGALKVEVFDGGDSHTVDDGGGSLTVDGTVTANAGTGTFTTTSVGTVADDATTPGAPVMIGGQAKETDGTDPGSVSAEDDVVRAIFDRNRRQLVNTVHPNLWTVNENHSSAQTNNQLKAAPGANLSLYITDVIISNGATAGTVKLVEDEGGTPVDKGGPYYLAVNGGAALHFTTPIRLTANKSLGFTSASVTTHTVEVHGYIAP